MLSVCVEPVKADEFGQVRLTVKCTWHSDDVPTVQDVVDVLAQVTRVRFMHDGESMWGMYQLLVRWYGRTYVVLVDSYKLAYATIRPVVSYGYEVDRSIEDRGDCQVATVADIC